MKNIDNEETDLIEPEISCDSHPKFDLREFKLSKTPFNDRSNFSSEYLQIKEENSNISISHKISNITALHLKNPFSDFNNKQKLSSKQKNNLAKYNIPTKISELVENSRSLVEIEKNEEILELENSYFLDDPKLNLESIDSNSLSDEIYSVFVESQQSLPKDTLIDILKRIENGTLKTLFGNFGAGRIGNVKENIKNMISRRSIDEEYLRSEAELRNELAIIIRFKKRQERERSRI